MTKKFETIEFVIEGNQEKLDGNAIPYHRTTQGSYWNEASKRYAAWKDYVLLAMATKGYRRITLRAKQRARMDIKIYWHDHHHADADNVFKGIADAAFYNDKGLAAGSFESEQAGNKKGRVEVKIEIYTP